MSYTSSDPENLHRVPEASTSGQAPKTKKKPWSKFKSSIKSIGEKMSAKPKFTESTESSEQKRARKNKKFKSGEEGVGEESPSKTSSKGLMKKLSVESLATPFVGMQPSTINPAKSYAKAVNSTGSTSESNLSTSDPDTPKKTPTPDSGRASQATDGEEAAIGSLVAKTEQFAQSLLPPQAANEKLKDVSAEFVKTEGRSPGQRKKPNEVEEDGRAKGSVETKRELKADTKQDLSKGAVDDVEGRRKKMGASVDLIKAESGVEPKAEEKIAPTRKQKSEEKMVRDKEALEGKTDKNDKQLKPDAKNNQSNRQNPTKGIDKSIKEQKTGKPDEKSATLAKEASKTTPIPDSAEVKQPTKDTTKDKEPKENKEGSKTVQKASDTEKQKTTVDKKGHAFKDVTEGSKIMQNVSDKENKQPTKDVKKEDPSKEKKEESKTTPTSEKAQPIKDIKKVDLSEENREESKTTPTSEKAQSTKDVKKGVAPKEKKEDSKTTAKASDKENKLGGKDTQQEGANSSIDPTDRLMSTERRPSPSQGGLTVEEKLEAFLSAESWPSSLREEVAQSSSGKTSQQGGGDKRECLYKILVIGELGTGKTSIIKRYVHQFFSQHYRATIGVDFALKVLNWDPNTIIRLQLWDIAGQERFGNMTRVYYKEAVGAFIVFDVTRSATFDAVLKWKQDLDSKVQLADGGPIPCVLLANKCDQQKEGLVNTPSKMDDYCKENNFSAWFETSAKENINIDDAAKSLVTQILQNDKMSQNGRDSARDGSKFPLDGKQEEEGGGGCAC